MKIIFIFLFLASMASAQADNLENRMQSSVPTEAEIQAAKKQGKPVPGITLIKKRKAKVKQTN